MYEKGREIMKEKNKQRKQRSIRNERTCRLQNVRRNKTNIKQKKLFLMKFCPKILNIERKHKRTAERRKDKRKKNESRVIERITIKRKERTKIYMKT